MQIISGSDSVSWKEANLKSIDVIIEKLKNIDGRFTRWFVEEDKNQKIIYFGSGDCSANKVGAIVLDVKQDTCADAVLKVWEQHE